MAPKPKAPLCPELEAFILAEVSRLNIVPHGIIPKVDKSGKVRIRMPVLSDAFVADNGKWHIYVWAGASGRTIWSAPAVNVAFRAWHDSTHLATGLDFSPAQEKELARRTVLEASARGLSDDGCCVLFAETAGQIEHFEKHAGAFPENQRAFVKAYAAGKWAGERY